MNVGDRIKQRREELGLSVEDIAKMLGKHRATIYRYESDEIEKFPTNVLEPLATVLQTTPSALMGWGDAVTPSPGAVDAKNKQFSIDALPKLDKTLLDLFHRLNPEGKNRLIEEAEMLVKNEKFMLSPDKEEAV